LRNRAPAIFHVHLPMTLKRALSGAACDESLFGK
jgi:hypothetical protein